jgi:DNA polymerase-1
MGLISQKFIPPMGGSHGERNGPGDAPADFVSSLPTGLLNTVQQRAGNDPVSAPKTPPFPEKEVFISNVEGVRSVIEACAAVPRIGFDTETTGLDPRTDRLCLIQLATGEHTFLIDALAVDLALLRPVFEGTAELAGFNLVFDIQMLHAAGLTVTAPLFDCMLAAQILEARGNARPDEPKRPSRRKGDYDLVHVAARYLGETVSKDEQQSNWRARPLSSEQLAYAARDAEVVLRLADVLHTRLVDGDLVPTATLDFSIVPQLAEMQLRGCPFDLAAWRALSDAALADTLAAEEAMRALLAAEMPDDPEAQPWTPPLGKRGKPLKRKPPVPVWSSTMSYKGRPSRLTALLRRRGHQVDATDDVVLVQIAEHDRFVQLLRDWRDATTRSGRYGITWPAGHADEAAGRIYATFWQCWAETGRLSSDKPNLQNIPGNPAYRRCFRAAPGKLLVRADYSQIELVITAVISQDATMLATLAAGGDLHCLTASRVLGVPEDAVTDAQRQLAKNLNFGLLFGMGPAALVEYLATRGIASTLKEATRFHARFHLTYEGLDRWQHAWGNGQGETRSLYGRRRLDVRKYTERLNSPVQCSGADLIKDALRRLWEDRASAPSARIVNAVHDEILAECGADDAPAVEAWLRGHMLAAGQAMLPSMPPRVESSIGPDWTKHPKAAQQGAGAKESSR